MHSNVMIVVGNVIVNQKYAPLRVMLTVKIT